MDDTTIYPNGQSYIYRNQIFGFVRGYIPFLGWIVIILQSPTHLLKVFTPIFGGIRV